MKYVLTKLQNKPNVIYNNNKRNENNNTHLVYEHILHISQDFYQFFDKSKFRALQKAKLRCRSSVAMVHFYSVI